MKVGIPMKKRLLWLVPVVPALLILLVLLAPVLIPGEKAAGFLARRIHLATGADVTLGSVEVRVWPRVRVVLGEGSLAGDLGDSGLETVGWKSASLDLDPGSLLVGRLNLSAVEAGGLSMSGVNGRHRYRAEEGRVRARGLELALESEDGNWLPPGKPVPLDLAAGVLRFDDLEFRDLTGQGSVTGDTLRLRRLTGKLGTGQAEVSGTLALTGRDDRPVRFVAEIQGVPVAALLAGPAPELAGKWEGDLDGRATGDFLLRKGEFVPESLVVEGRLEGGSGVVHARQWLASVAGYLGSRQDLLEIHYDRLEHSFSVRDGRYLVDLDLAGPQTDWSVSGWVGLAGNLDLAVLVKLPPGFTPDLGSLSLLASALRDKEGRIALALRLSGRTRHPEVSVDLEKSLQGAGGKTGSALGKGLGGLLDKLKVR